MLLLVVLADGVESFPFDASSDRTRASEMSKMVNAVSKIHEDTDFIVVELRQQFCKLLLLLLLLLLILGRSMLSHGDSSRSRMNSGQCQFCQLFSVCVFVTCCTVNILTLTVSYFARVVAGVTTVVTVCPFTLLLFHLK